MTKYANVINGIIDSITYDPDREWIIESVQVPILDEDGNETGEFETVVTGGHWGEILPPWIPVDDDVFAGYVAGPNDTWIPPEPEEQPEPEPIDVTAVTVGIAQLNIADGEVAALPLSSRFTAAMQMGTGEFWVFFKETQPDTNYLALVYPVAGAFAFVQESNKFEDFFIISVTDFAGNPTDVECLSLEVKRVG